MKWSRLTIALFVLSMILMVTSGFLLLMMLGGPPGSIDKTIGRHGFPVAVLGWLASGVGAWISHSRASQRPRRGD
jgi:hypothetical protein